jgi:hypothetical protein
MVSIELFQAATVCLFSGSHERRAAPVPCKYRTLFDAIVKDWASACGEYAFRLAVIEGGSTASRVATFTGIA